MKKSIIGSSDVLLSWYPVCLLRLLNFYIELTNLFRCDTAAMKTRKDRGDPPAVSLLYSKIESYFFDGTLDYNCKVRETTLPPIYFQHPGKSSSSRFYMPI